MNVWLFVYVSHMRIRVYQPTQTNELFFFYFRWIKSGYRLQHRIRSCVLAQRSRLRQHSSVQCNFLLCPHNDQSWGGRDRSHRVPCVCVSECHNSIDNAIWHGIHIKRWECAATASSTEWCPLGCTQTRTNQWTSEGKNKIILPWRDTTALLTDFDKIGQHREQRDRHQQMEDCYNCYPTQRCYLLCSRPMCIITMDCSCLLRWKHACVCAMHTVQCVWLYIGEATSQYHAYTQTHRCCYRVHHTKCTCNIYMRVYGHMSESITISYHPYTRRALPGARNTHFRLFVFVPEIIV